MGTVQYLDCHQWSLGAWSGWRGDGGVDGGVALTRLPLYRIMMLNWPIRHPDLPAVPGSCGLGLPDPDPAGFHRQPDPGSKIDHESGDTFHPIPAGDDIHWLGDAGRIRQADQHLCASRRHPFILFLAAFLVYSIAGCYKAGAPRKILYGMAGGAVKSSLGIVTMVGMATIMFHTGMTNLLALGLSEGVGPALYPLVSPFIGALGAFITGSNNNSNVLFAVLQQNTAKLLGLSVTMILAAQTTGGALGSIMAPAKVIVGCSTVGLSGKEGQVIREMLRYGLLLIVFSAIITLLLIQIV